MRKTQFMPAKRLQKEKVNQQKKNKILENKSMMSQFFRICHKARLGKQKILFAIVSEIYVKQFKCSTFLDCRANDVDTE